MRVKVRGRMCAFVVVREEEQERFLSFSRGGEGRGRAGGGLLGLNEASLPTQRICENKPLTKTKATLFSSAETPLLTLHPYTTFGPRYLGLSQGAF